MVLLECKYCKQSLSDKIPSCCYPKVNKAIMEEMCEKSIKKVYQVNDYYRKKVILKLNNNEEYSIMFTGGDVYFEKENIYREIEEKKASYYWIFLLVSLIVNFVLFNLVKRV
jgi:hypothetical protein